MFCPSRQASPLAASPHARGSREFTPPFAALPSAVRGVLRRRSRLSHPAVRGTSCRRSRLSDPAVRGSWRRRSRPCHPRSREFMPPFADHPALSSQEMTPPSTANPSLPARRWLNARRPPLTQCPPACLWLNARRPASDSSPPDCRWLKLAGLPLTQARRIAADSWPLVVVGRESQLTSQFTPPSAAHRPRRSREITPPSVGKANPPSAAASSVAGKATRRPRFTRPAAGWGSLQPAGPCRCVVKPAGCCRYLSSQPVMVSPAGRCRIDKPAGRGRIWPDCDQGLFNCLCVFSPGGLLIPLSFPKEILGGG